MTGIATRREMAVNGRVARSPRDARTLDSNGGEILASRE